MNRTLLAGMTLALVLAAASATVAQERPLADLLSALASADTGGQLSAAREVESRGLAHAPGVQETMTAALLRDLVSLRAKRRVARRDDEDEDSGDAVGYLIPLYVRLYGLGDRKVALSLLRSNTYSIRSQLAYDLADQGTALLADVLEMRGDPGPSHRANAVAVLADMIMEQRRGRVAHPLDGRQRASVMAAVEAAAASADVLASSAAIWELSVIRDPAAIPALRRAAAVDANPMRRPAGSWTAGDAWVGTTPWDVADAIAVIRFCKDPPPETAPRLRAVLAGFRASSWERRARSFYALIAGNSDPYWAPEVPGILRRFPGESGVLTTAFISLLQTENTTIRATKGLRHDMVYGVYYAKVAQSVLQLKSPASVGALLDAVGFDRNAAFFLPEIGGPAAVHGLVRISGESDARRRNFALLGLDETPHWFFRRPDWPLWRARLRPIFRHSLADPDSGVRVKAARGLGVIGTDRDAQLLLKMGQADEIPAVRAQARASARRIQMRLARLARDHGGGG